jgi:thiamine pyrophosphokinase
MAGETILILADGDWRGAQRLRSLAKAADRIIAANGGSSKALAHGVRIDEVIGDLDSIPEIDREALIEAGTPVVHAFPRDKDWTDLELAIDHALRREPGRIHLFGVLGERVDHTLTSLHLLEKGLERGIPIVLYTRAESARLVESTLTLEGAGPGDRVSLIPITPSATVTTEGLRYPLRGESLVRSASRGVSNEVVGLPVRIDVAEGLLLVVHGDTGREDS